MTNHDATLTTTTPDGASTTRPVPPGIASVWLLVARWRLALVPDAHGTWDVLAGYPAAPWPHYEQRRVPFAALPQAIADVAARCAADAREET